MTALYPLRLEGDLRPKIWGAADLRPFFAIQGQPVGEAWYSHEENVVRNGPLMGRTIGEIVDQFGVELLGGAYKASGRRRRSVGQSAGTGTAPYFPILAKLLFTSAKLSVQVHPDDAYAMAHEGGAGKAEMWYVVEAEPGARINAGLIRPMTTKELAVAARTGAIERDLRWLEVQAGDAVYIQPGALHTIGPGLTICEIQQNSDLTYRFYDFNRLDAEGRLRELHVDQAARIARTELQPTLEGSDRIACEYFVTDVVRLEQPTDWRPDGKSFDLLIFLSGHGSLREGETYAPGIAYLVPAAAETFTIHPAEPTRVMHARLPG